MCGGCYECGHISIGYGWAIETGEAVYTDTEGELGVEVDVMAEYEVAQKGALKLKGVDDLSLGKRKKKKDKDKNKMMQQILTNKKNEEEKKRPALDKRTPAQLAFEKMQEKRQMERILKKASKTHKQRVEDFNRHLDALTEHYDIPKVSWTK